MAFNMFSSAITQLLTSPGVMKDLQAKGEAVKAHAQAIVPVRTGALQASIVVESGRDSRGPYVQIGSHLYYAIFVELGTSRMAAQPYLRPALAAITGRNVASTQLAGDSAAA